jgi:hypothetical protein
MRFGFGFMVSARSRLVITGLYHSRNLWDLKRTEKLGVLVAFTLCPVPDAVVDLSGYRDCGRIGLTPTR